MKKIKALLFILSAILLFSCSQPSLDDELLESAPGSYSITYNREFGLFIIKRKQTTDTVSLWDNWLYPLYRYRQQQKDISSGTSYDEFLKSDFFCLPGSEQQFKLINNDPLKAFTSMDGPGMCECMTEKGEYNIGSPACEEKFQVFRSSFNDNHSWHFAYFRDRCNGKISDTLSVAEFKDSVLAVAKIAELRMLEIQRKQDSADAGKPKVRCSGSDYVPPFRRVSSFRISEQCKAMTTSGRCRRHGG